VTLPMRQSSLIYVTSNSFNRFLNHWEEYLANSELPDCPGKADGSPPENHGPPSSATNPQQMDYPSEIAFPS